MRLKELRKQAKLTQKEIAEKIGITQFTYCNYENGKTQPPIEMLITIANFYEVTLDYLCERPVEPKIYDNLTKKQRSCLELISQLTNEQLDRAEAYLTAQAEANYEIKREIK